MIAMLCALFWSWGGVVHPPNCAHKYALSSDYDHVKDSWRPMPGASPVQQRGGFVEHKARNGCRHEQFRGQHCGQDVIQIDPQVFDQRFLLAGEQGHSRKDCFACHTRSNCSVEARPRLCVKILNSVVGIEKQANVDGWREPRVFRAYADEKTSVAGQLRRDLLLIHDQIYSDPWPSFGSEKLSGLFERFGAVLSGGFEEREGSEEQERGEQRQEASNSHKPYRVSRNDVFWVIGFPAILGAVIGGLAIYAVSKSIESRGRPREPEGDDWYG